jgi:cation:H+ antiporter
METLIASILFLIGILLIVKGGDLFVDAATWMATASGIPQFIIGATIVSLATTLPEMLVSAMAAADLKTEMAIGNAIGSVTANTGLIMGISLVFMPVAIRRSEISIKGAIMVLSTLFLWLLSASNGLTVAESIVLLVLFAAFIAENVHSAAQNKQPQHAREPVEKRDLVKNIVLFLVGAVALVIGSDLLVDNGTILAVALGVPERIIAVTMIAIGTSLPELVTAITAIAKKQSSLSVGNILGANIIDITIILPVCALISHGTLPVSAASIRVDMPVCLIETVIAVIPTLILKRFTRVQGLIMIAIYLAYLGFTVFA